MRFNSYTFFVFLTVFLAVYVPVRTWSWRAGKAVLLGFSYAFYAWTYPPYLLLLFATTCVDFYCARRIAAAPHSSTKKKYLFLTLALNLSFLAYFKYANFVLGTVADLGGTAVPAWDVVLPVGISFYVFESLSYTIDVYRGVLPCERSFSDYALFISFFPHLVAGPIVKARDFLIQLKSDRRVSSETLRSGVFLVIFGYFLKAAIADNLAPGVDRFFSAPAAYSRAEAWFYVYGYAFQIFGDFAGYSAVAIGLSRCLGYELPVNFDWPYFSASFQEFWKRWHISLSSWLKEYLYVPLGGNRSGTARTAFNLMATMLIGGLWHGASWNFVLWGGLHGLGLVAERIVLRSSGEPSPVWRGVRAVLVFHAVCLAWVLFRCPTLAGAGGVLTALFFGTSKGFAVPLAERLPFFLMVAVHAAAALRRSPSWRETAVQGRALYWETAVVCACLFWTLAFGVNANSFIYFRF
jgi:D-alanyl-lipoteichoic acid acyltransferase DltB (MBOAT superfamily)